jgi:hypothetical protein
MGTASMCNYDSWRKTPPLGSPVITDGSRTRGESPIELCMLRGDRSTQKRLEFLAPPHSPPTIRSREDKELLFYHLAVKKECKNSKYKSQYIFQK